MKKSILLFCSVLLLSCAKYVADIHTTHCSSATNGFSYSRGRDLDGVLQQIVVNGTPGAVMAVQTDEGLWETAKGYAKIEDKTPMQLCQLQYLQSISKTYLAVAILKLSEQGRIVLDTPIKKYLPQKYYRYLGDAENITVRTLLNHTSGIPDYNFRPEYVSYLLQHPDHYFVPQDYLKYINGKKPLFPPGSRHSYSNINYVILSLIADSISGNHAKLISETIFKPLGLVSTYYRDDSGYLRYAELVNSYWDRYSNGIVENVSRLQRMNVSTLVGDDGIVTTPGDAIKFLKGLVEGKLLADSTFQQMKTWVRNKQGEPVYGLGLHRRTINGYEAYGHSGGGIGAGCELYYFPAKKLYYFIAINLGTVTESPLHGQLGKLRSEL
ncbi:MAG TPA: serine hydrolase domain-containing protein, partial [Chitinophagaceae bacterium]|nr:serine hydrolase domain-containing protein [Chitinophagaceae bacterium]